MEIYKQYKIINPYEDQEFFKQFQNGEKLKQSLFLLEPNIYHVFPIEWFPPCEEMIKFGCSYYWHGEGFYTIEDVKSEIDLWEKEENEKLQRQSNIDESYLEYLEYGEFGRPR